MKIEEQLCPLEQAKILSELELWPWSQFYWIREKGVVDWHVSIGPPAPAYSYEFYNAFTVGEMIEILNKYSNWEFIDISDNMALYLAEILIEEIKGLQIDPTKVNLD